MEKEREIFSCLRLLSSKPGSLYKSCTSTWRRANNLLMGMELLRGGRRAQAGLNMHEFHE
jgi:hypothetical protein